MKLISLYVEGLYGCYNYDVSFNSDVTFLYGENGCGKTTILNITEAIITGKIFELFDYKFKTIKLVYTKKIDNTEPENILLTLRKRIIHVEFENKSYDLELNIGTRDFQSYERINLETNRYYFDEYPFLTKIQELFNSVYLPLNRSIRTRNIEMDYLLARRYRNKVEFEEQIYPDSNIQDWNIKIIEYLTREKCSKINLRISKINDEFRNNVLKSLLEIGNQRSLSETIKDIKNNRNFIQNLVKDKDKYINILKDLNLLTTSEEKKYSQFFEDFINEYLNLKNIPKNQIFDFILRFKEISKIKNLLNIAKEAEHKKALARKPIEIFLKTMNDFVQSGEDIKTIEINTEGSIFFKTKNSDDQISLIHLSSGEKQLLMFFWNLVFQVENNSPSIFVVDEPELSLHLSWQKSFVDKTLEINKNIQLIFATHSPEIIGRRRDKMFKLKKTIIK